MSLTSDLAFEDAIEGFFRPGERFPIPSWPFARFCFWMAAIGMGSGFALGHIGLHRYAEALLDLASTGLFVWRAIAAHRDWARGR